MTEHADDVQRGGLPIELDPDAGFILSAFGRKGSGKTTLNRHWFRSYPHAKLCIDVNGEADPGPTAEDPAHPRPGEVVRIRHLAPAMPKVRPGEPAPALHYVADPGSVTYRDDLDRAVGMAMMPSDAPALVWGGEVGELSQSNRTGPHLRRLLMQSRHYKTSALFDGPRPIDIDKLVIAQADYVAVYDLPDPDDRDRVAKVIGWPPRDFARECDETFRRGEYWFLLWASKAKRLYRMPPLPVGRS